MKEGRPTHLMAEAEPLEAERLSVIWAQCENLPMLNRSQMGQQIVSLAVQGMRRAPVTSVLTLVTIGFSLFLLSVFLLIVHNTGQVVSSVTEKTGVSIYIKDGVDDQIIEQLKTELVKFPGVTSVARITKDQALKVFRKMVGEDSPMVLGLDEKNPLPQSLEVSLSKSSVTEDTYLRIVNDFSLSPHVESVRFNQGALSQLGALLRAIRFGGWIGTLVMLLITGLLVSNAIRLAIYSHRTEIEIMELVGATEQYIRAPFLVEGALEGFIGAVLGLILLYLSFAPIERLYKGSPLEILVGGELSFLGFFNILLVVVAGTLIGLVASYLAARKFSSHW